MPKLGKLLTRIGYCGLVSFAWISVLIFFVWAIGALAYLTTVPTLVGLGLAAGYLIFAVWSWRHLQTKSRWLSTIAASVIGVYLITLSQQPSNDRNWAEEQSRVPAIELHDGVVTIQNFRHVDYRSPDRPVTEWLTKEFRIEDLQSVWYTVQKFSALESLAHTFLSFEFSSDLGPQYFCVSVEVRREDGEQYSPIRGLYRQYELIYVIGDERDIVGVRTNVRQNDRVHMYKVNATPEQVQSLFQDIAGRVERLRSKPKFYHTLLNNCTNSIVMHTYRLTPTPINWLDPRIVLPGFSDRFAFSKGLIGGDGQSFSELQEACRIDEVARNAELDESFSTRIRATQR